MSDQGAWETSHVLFAAADKATGAVTCQLGDVYSGAIVDPDAPAYGIWGAVTLPAPPIPGVAAAEAITLNGTSCNMIIGGRSVRSASIAKLIKMGESAFFADGSMARTLYKLDGSIVSYSTHDNTDAGRAVFQSVGPAGYEFSWPWGRTIIDKSGWSTIHVGGASIHCGQLVLSGPFAPMNAAGLTTYVALTAATVRINGSLVSLGPDTGVPEPVVKAASLTTVLTLIGVAMAQMGAVTAALSAITVNGNSAALTGPAVPPKVGTLAIAFPEALSEALAAIGTALATIGSTSVNTT